MLGDFPKVNIREGRRHASGERHKKEGYRAVFGLCKGKNSCLVREGSTSPPDTAGDYDGIYGYRSSSMRVRTPRKRVLSGWNSQTQSHPYTRQPERINYTLQQTKKGTTTSDGKRKT